MKKFQNYDIQIEWLQALESYIHQLLDIHKEKLKEIGQEIIENILQKIEKPENKFFISFFICKVVGDYFIDILLSDFIELEEIKLQEFLGEDYEKFKKEQEKEPMPN